VGEYMGGRWYGAMYGWSWPHGFYNIGACGREYSLYSRGMCGAMYGSVHGSA
jgi:hypothetical protein